MSRAPKLRLLAKIGTDAWPQDAKALAEMARQRPVLAERDIDEIGVDDLVRGHLGAALGFERVRSLDIAGDQRLAVIARPAVRRAEYHVAVPQVVGDQDDGEGRALGE